jgi:NAD(P)-dependent dehydrogenase (short-subunit alcohol dehydrogenase family)
MEDKICVVTGANSGIGKWTALELVERGAHVVMACRNEERGSAALEEIREETGRDHVELMLVDLADRDAIRSFVEEFEAAHPRLDVLVNNAGVYLDDRWENEAGEEMTFAVNHLGTFALTVLLRDRLEAAASGRVVTVSSMAHRFGGIDFEDLFYERRRYVPLKVYGDSKLANVLFTRELARRFADAGVIANALHPGMVDTNLSADEGGWFGTLAKLSSPFLLSPRQGASTSVHLACDPEVADVSGRYFAHCGRRRASGKSRDEALARRLWAVSEELTDIRW